MRILSGIEAMFGKRGITFKAVALFLLIATAILAIVYSYNYSVSRRIIVDLAEENSRIRGSDIAHLITAKIKPVESLVKNVALTLENPDLSRQAVIDLTREIVKRNTTVFGTAIAFEPFEMVNDRLFFAPYSYRAENAVSSKMLGNSSYHYFNLDWYQLPKMLDRPAWTEPYFDAGGGEVLMATYSVPFYRNRNGKRHFAGVVTADLSLQWLQDTISGTTLYKTGYAALLSRNGRFISHPSQELILNETIFSLAETLGDDQLWEIGRSVTRGETGFVPRQGYSTGRPGFLYYMPLPVGGWSLCFILPRDEVLSQITDLTRKTLIINLIGLLTLAFAIVWLTRKFTRPLISLSESAAEISGGDLDAAVPAIAGTDEMGQLTASFRDMQTSLKQHIRELTETTAAKERIESELRIARNIQMSILPKLFPPYPERHEFDIFASIEPAREIGGDLYDFFFIDDHRFCFLIGDVSDKGVPAAFFMAVTKTLLKVVAAQTPDPGAILSRVNNDLADGNDSCMFVTLFLAVFDLRTGVVITGNAGHSPPVLFSEHGVDLLPCTNEPLAGAMEGMTYTSRKMQLSPGDALFLYTDGVTEAMNQQRELYSDNRLLEELKAMTAGRNLAPEEIVGSIGKSVGNFTKGAEQSDDITMLCFRFNQTTTQK